MTLSALHIKVHGRVQGVWFRASAQERARQLEITGWARNAADGSVEIHAEGEPDNLDRFVHWCRQGPPAARVSKVDLESVAPEQMQSFDIR